MSDEFDLILFVTTELTNYHPLKLTCIVESVKKWDWLFFSTQSASGKISKEYTWELIKGSGCKSSIKFICSSRNYNLPIPPQVYRKIKNMQLQGKFDEMRSINISKNMGLRMK